MTFIPKDLRLRLDNTLQDLEEGFVSVTQLAGSSLSPDDYLRVINHSDLQLNTYHTVPPLLQSVYERLEATSGPEAINVFNKYLMLRMMLSADEHMSELKITENIKQLILAYFDRVLREITSDVVRNFRLENDLRAKDMAVCRLRLIPCGAELVDRYSGVPRRIMVSSNLKQVFNAAMFFSLKCRHFKGFLESHWDRRLISNFHADGFDRCYQNVASLLEHNPQYHGLFGSAWWFDPVIKDISPELSFLQERFAANGALSIRLGIDEDAIKDATFFSPLRTSLYEAGKYTPCRYMMIWHRDDILRWRDTL